MKDTPSVHWRKSSYSGHEGGNCVEVAHLASLVGVRDSKDPDGLMLAFSAGAWHVFATDIKSGVHDRA